MNKLWYIPTIEYGMAVKMDVLELHAVTQSISEIFREISIEEQMQ